MTDLWYPEAIKNLADASLWGPATPGVHWRGVLHTTESTWYHPFPGPQPLYDGFGHNFFPQFTLDATAGAGQFYQHMPANRTARALLNTSAPGETNRFNAVQVEIVWQAANAPALPKSVLDTLAKWMRWCETNLGIGRHGLAFHPYPPPGGIQLGKEPWRMNESAWVGFNGWCGHQHVPENLHGDPGLIDIEYLLAEPAPEPEPQPEDDMDYPTAIRTLYQVHLGREPDRPGFHSWCQDYASKVAAGGNPVAVMAGIEGFFSGVTV